jgi:hypothetical protein
MIKIKYQKKDIDKKNITNLSKKQSRLLVLATPAARKKFIDTNPDWRKLSEDLARLSEYKCWYTEVYEIGSYFHVDHLRPKKGIELKPGLKLQNAVIPPSMQQEGYWWECYNWKNYRLLAAKPNSGYKGNYFPISNACSFWDNRANVSSEVPLLLDPLKQEDCDLILFDSDGKVIANPIAVIQGSLEEAKVEATIQVYGLNDDAFVRARKKEWKFTDKLAQLADEIHNKLGDPLDTDIEDILKKTKTLLVDTIKSRVSKSAEFSRLNHCCLVATGKKWIRKEVLNLK